MAYAIKDLNTNEYYRQRLGSNSWYTFDINESRLYGNKQQAQRTIDNNDHHVSYPGNRNLMVIKIKLVEITTE